VCHAGRKARQLAYRTADKRSAIAGEEKKRFPENDGTKPECL
jgi:hypothetical protein